jgi:hypothetical protein
VVTLTTGLQKEEISTVKQKCYAAGTGKLSSVLKFVATIIVRTVMPVGCLRAASGASLDTASTNTASDCKLHELLQIVRRLKLEAMEFFMKLVV